MTLSWCASTLVFGLNPRILSLATWAFDLPTCSFLNRNCLFKLLTSIVSKSICKNYSISTINRDNRNRRRTTSISGKPVRAKFLSTSQPIPPAPTTNIFDLWIASAVSLGRAFGILDNLLIFSFFNNPPQTRITTNAAKRNEFDRRNTNFRQANTTDISLKNWFICLWKKSPQICRNLICCTFS